LSTEADPSLSLEAVRARIFYLAGDVESVSPPAAMLLRAVAGAIEEGGEAGDLKDDHIVAALGQITNFRKFANGTAAAVARSFEVIVSRPDGEM
jgi:hypothetical protein